MFTGRSEAIAFLEIIRLVQDERSKCLHIVLVYGSTLEFGSKMKHIKTFKDFKDNINLFTIPRDKRSILVMCRIIEA